MKYFPIQTATACPWKWNWTTLYLYTGKTASCHRTGHSYITPETFDTFHNTEKKQQERQQMLNGQWPTGSCEVCREIEQVGGVSDRIRQLSMPDQTPLELFSNPTALSVDPTILEVFFNNTCNLQCLYCTPWLSSKINQEHKKFGEFKKNGVLLEPVNIDINYKSMLEKFWAWMQQHSQSLKRFTVAGGESFYQPEFVTTLDYFESTSHPDLEFCTITNLQISPDRLETFIARFKNLHEQKKLKRIDLTVSLDCWGPEQEFVRHGLDLALWQRNFERLLQEPYLTLNLNQTISVLTIKTMPELLQRLQQWREIHPVSHSFSTVAPGPSYLDPAIMDPALFSADFQRIIELMPTENDHDAEVASHMKSIIERIQRSKANPVEMKKLLTFLNEKDRRRDTDWKALFPWLVKEFDKCGIVE